MSVHFSCFVTDLGAQHMRRCNNGRTKTLVEMP